jgi:hypothetical protein
MASMCSNPDCGNIRRVEGVCPECGSPSKDLGFREGTALIKLKKENMNRREDEAKAENEAETQEITFSEIDDEAVDKEDDRVTDEIESIDGEVEKEEAVNTVKLSNNPLVKILVFIGVVIVFYIVFRFML